MKTNKSKLIQEQAVVVAAYYGNTRGVNLHHLIMLWEEAGGEFADYYPYAADNFQLMSCSFDSDLILTDLIEQFAYTPHLRIWVMGEEIDEGDRNHYLNYLKIDSQCGKPLHTIGQEVCFEYRGDRGYVTVSGIITAIKSDLEFCSWLCEINGVWYDQYLIEEQENEKV